MTRHLAAVVVEDFVVYLQQLSGFGMLSCMLLLCK